MSGLPKGEYKTNRKEHNQIFKYRQLKFYQYSKVVVRDTTTLNIYIYKWFIALIAIPMLLYGLFVIGLIPTFKELIELWADPVSFDSLHQVPDGLLKSGNEMKPQNK
ncbi:hypothetical protein [Xenorhabdus sp. KK7.4]|uniref:hypothetical protein n=1 Tax=Xenorhabdus sp. KK7.4 TaxID=1851572 RepID=UPI000C03C935|nr:hypothetical protein [Xenorhabdus sp. KK7.4]PHM54549.1 hypothetical protein Xekk_02535 [Xenorhabdus sp. KK7.4]